LGSGKKLKGAQLSAAPSTACPAAVGPEDGGEKAQTRRLLLNVYFQVPSASEKSTSRPS